MKVVKRKFNNYIMYCRAKNLIRLISKIKKDPFYPLKKQNHRMISFKKTDRPFETVILSNL